MGKRVRARKQRKETTRKAPLAQAKARRHTRLGPLRRKIWFMTGAIVIIAAGVGLGIVFKNTFPAQPNNDITIPKTNDSLTATIQTAKGTIKFQLFALDAPKTVKNFVLLTRRGYYDGLKFHRVEPGFVIQGGDPQGNGSGGESAFGGSFEDELNPQTQSYQTGYVKGTVAMANSGPNTNRSQFFIILEEQANLPRNYTIFGRVTEGMEAASAIIVGDVMQKVTIEGLAPNTPVSGTPQRIEGLE